MVPYYLQDASAPLPFAFHQVGWPFIGWVVSIGALFGLSTSLLGAMFPLPRVLYAMSSDGLIFRWLSVVHPKYQVNLKNRDNWKSYSLVSDHIYEYEYEQ